MNLIKNYKSVLLRKAFANDQHCLITSNGCLLIKLPLLSKLKQKVKSPFPYKFLVDIFTEHTLQAWQCFLRFDARAQ